MSDLPNIPQKVEESSKGWPLWLALFDAGAFYVSIKSAGGGAGGRGVVGAYAGVSVADPPLPSVPLPFVLSLGVSFLCGRTFKNQLVPAAPRAGGSGCQVLVPKKCAPCP